MFPSCLISSRRIYPFTLGCLRQPLFTTIHAASLFLPIFLPPFMPPFPPAPPIMSQTTLQCPVPVPVPPPCPRVTLVTHRTSRVKSTIIIEDFLSEYEELADEYGLTDRQKVKTIICYIPLSLRDFWKSLDGCLAHSWMDLRLTPEEIYESTSARSRHSKQKLLDLVRHSSKSCMNNEDVLCYYRQILTLSKPLLNAQRLRVSTNPRNNLFW